MYKKMPGKTQMANETFHCMIWNRDFVQGQPTQSQLILIYSMDWTDVYDTHNIEHRTESVDN